MTDEKTVRGRRGPKILPSAEKRTHCVSVRLNDGELDLVNRRRGRLQAGSWLRAAAIDTAPTMIPEINKQAWSELSRAASSLHQIAKKLNFGNDFEIDLIASELSVFRLALLGVSQKE